MRAEHRRRGRRQGLEVVHHPDVGRVGQEDVHGAEHGDALRAGVGGREQQVVRAAPAGVEPAPVGERLERARQARLRVHDLLGAR